MSESDQTWNAGEPEGQDPATPDASPGDLHPDFTWPQYTWPPAASSTADPGVPNSTPPAPHAADTGSVSWPPTQPTPTAEPTTQYRDRPLRHRPLQQWPL